MEEALLERIANKAAEKAAAKVFHQAAELAVKKIDEMCGPKIERMSNRQRVL